MPRPRWLTPFLVVTIAATLGVSPLVQAHGEGSQMFRGADKIIMPFAETAPSVDGVLGPGEYSDHGAWAEGEELQVSLAHNASAIFVGVRQAGIGWLSVALSSDIDSGANVIEATANATSSQVSDNFAAVVSDEMENVPDVSEGGTSDIFAFAATQGNGTTTYEFAIPLDSADPHDQHFEEGAIYPFVVAFNETAQGLPDAFVTGDVHFFMVYVARASDNLAAIRTEFEGAPSPVPTLVVMAALSFGIGTIAWRYLGPRKEESS